MALKGLGLSGFQQSTKPKIDEELLKLQDGDQVKIRLLQELDEDSPEYDPDMGRAQFYRVWSSPRDYRKEIVDTSDEGGCIPQELSRIKGNWRYGWRFKDFMFVNVLVVDKEGNETVKFMKNNLNEKAVEGPTLRDHFLNNENTVTDQWFVYSRTGKGVQDTRYTLTPVKKGPHDKPVSDYKDDLIDLEKKVTYVPYDEQRAYLGVNDTDYLEKVEGPEGKMVPVGQPAVVSDVSNSAPSSEDDVDLDW